MGMPTTAATSLPSASRPSIPRQQNPLDGHRYHHQHRRSVSLPLPRRAAAPVRAFQRSDFDGFAKKVTSGEALRDAWRSANAGFEQLLYESRIAAQRLDSRYSIRERLEDAFRSASYQARELDRKLGVGVRVRSFSLDFARNWPRYRRELNGFLETPLGKSSSTVFFIWFALSGWLFRVLIFATWVLPVAAPLLIATLANNLVIQGSCPACGRQFVGYRNQVIRCTNCRNIVWQSKDQSSRGRGGPSSSSSDPDIIDIEIEKD